MSIFRFKVGASVMCNLGPDGWKLGRIIALHYREEHWPAGRSAPYQVLLEGDHALIYVPEDDARYCREATAEDVRVAGRMDALAALPSSLGDTEPRAGATFADSFRGDPLNCSDGFDSSEQPGAAYRHGCCHCCHVCPRNWSHVELYSEHYRCASRNRLKVSRYSVDLGTVRVGQSIDRRVTDGLPTKEGYDQCPTWVRLPPGIAFSDDGVLSGQVAFDPHREASYVVEFVAVSTADWDDDSIGLVRVETTFVVQGNEPPVGFDSTAFLAQQKLARADAERALQNIYRAWTRWEGGALGNRETCEQLHAELRRLRDVLEKHPRLDGGRWWVQLGGFHMNVHKLLDNTLFECELYLGHALTFGDAEVRRLAEQNLAGCYQKRLLEAARFMWNDGIQQMMQGQWQAATETLKRAAAKKDGWGWAVNYGDIWLSEASARIIDGAERTRHDEADEPNASGWLAEAHRLITKASARAEESGAFGRDGHPWGSELSAALRSYRDLQGGDAERLAWLEAFKSRTLYWCAQVLAGALPFPPKVRPRLEDARVLIAWVRACTS